MTNRMRGFTLVELAVVIAIVALLLGALLVPLATQIQARHNNETRAALSEIKEALLGFAVTQGRLPCPDTTRDGLEDACAAGNQTEVIEGFLPWQTLATPPTDAWGRIFRYAVTREFTQGAVPGMPPGVPGRLDLNDGLIGNIRVVTRGDDPLTVGRETKTQIILGENVPAVVLSVGNNGSGGSLIDVVDIPVALGADELLNAPAVTAIWTCPPFCAPRVITQRPPTPPGAGCDDTAEGQPFCEFDDLVVWISAPVLLNRMVQARKLP